MKTTQPPRIGAARQGFTLIEVLIVIAIIVLLSVMLIPSFIGFLEGRKLRSGAAKIESIILRAKSDAIKSRRMHYVILDKYNSQLSLVDSGLDSSSDFDRTEETGELRFKSGSDDHVLPLDPSQKALPSGVFLARASESTTGSSLLFSEEIRCYPDGAVITASRNDVPTVTYLNGDGSRGQKGGDVVIVMRDPIFAPGDEANDERRGCFMDISPTTGRIRYEIDTWKRDYH